jgi:VWFA-related protein
MPAVKDPATVVKSRTRMSASSARIREMRLGAVVLGAALVAADGLSGQERQRFRVSTRLVEVNVVVQKDGKPVSGLTVDDFRFYDGGQEQRIEFFSVHTEVSATASAAPAPLPAPPESSVHEFSNRISIPGAATVILFDRLNTPVQDQMYARKHLLSFLRQIKSDDHVGI